jgi:hypothetical protein
MSHFFEETWVWWWFLAVAAILRSHWPGTPSLEQSDPADLSERYSFVSKQDPSKTVTKATKEITA